MRASLLLTSALVTFGAAFTPTKMTHGPVIRDPSIRDIKITYLIVKQVRI